MTIPLFSGLGEFIRSGVFPREAAWLTLCCEPLPLNLNAPTDELKPDGRLENATSLRCSPTS